MPLVTLFTKRVFFTPKHFGIIWGTLKDLNFYFPFAPPSKVRLSRNGTGEFVQKLFFFLIENPQKILVCPIHGLEFEKMLSKISVNLGQALQWHRRFLAKIILEKWSFPKRKRGQSGTINLLFILVPKMIQFL